jgi:hypothetical protein
MNIIIILKKRLEKTKKKQNKTKKKPTVPPAEMDGSGLGKR